jgi:hypothetical protein
MFDFLDQENRYKIAVCSYFKNENDVLEHKGIYQSSDPIICLAKVVCPILRKDLTIGTTG